MNRDRREAELREMLTTQRGKEEILALLRSHAGIEDGNLPPFGTLLVESILNYEYPADRDEPAAERVPAREPAEPGDEKLAQPPGTDALGG